MSSFIHYNAATIDYEEPPSELVIEGGTTMECFNIATVDDDIYAENEVFSITLSTSTTERVVITQSSAVIEITDDDGM